MKSILLLTDTFPFFSFRQYINFWKASNVSVMVYGVTNTQERDFFTHLGCPVIVDKVRELTYVAHKTEEWYSFETSQLWKNFLSWIIEEQFIYNVTIFCKSVTFGITYSYTVIILKE